MFNSSDFSFNDKVNSVEPKSQMQLMHDSIHSMEQYRIISDIFYKISSLESNDGVTTLSTLLDEMFTFDDHSDGYEAFVMDTLVMAFNSIQIPMVSLMDMIDTPEDLSLITDHINTVLDSSSAEELAFAVINYNDTLPLDEQLGNLDWTAYSNDSQCKKGADGKHPKLATHKCSKCSTYKKSGMKCRYPRKKNDKGEYVGVKPTAGEKAHLGVMHKMARTGTWAQRLSKAYKNRQGKADPHA